MNNNVKKVSVDFGGQEMSFQTGRMAHQAHGAVEVTHGELIILNPSDEVAIASFIIGIISS